MEKKRVLLMYISKNSGHHHATIAIENSLRQASGGIETLNINALAYTNPILGNIINKTYMSVIKRKPEVWGYLYDNPKVVQKTQHWKESVNRHGSDKLRGILQSFKPHAVVCTQAFPCGIMAEYKKSVDPGIKLFGVLTDYAPHSYWTYDAVDAYFVPSEDTGQRLVDNGISAEKIKNYGIPIEARFNNFLDKKPLYDKWGLVKGVTTVLLMGGSQGLGPIREMAAALNKINPPLQLVVICGDNRKLYRALKKIQRTVKKNFIVLPYVEEVDEVMELSDIVITKPGGITTAEALAKGLCMLIVNPIPGQEMMNAEFLLKNKVAIKAKSYHDVAVLVEELVRSQVKLSQMRERAKRIAKPDSSPRIAKEVLEAIK